MKKMKNYLILPLLLIGSLNTPAYGMQQSLANVSSFVHKVLFETKIPHTNMSVITGATLANVSIIVGCLIREATVNKIAIYQHIKYKFQRISNTVRHNLYLTKLKIKSYVKSHVFHTTENLTDTQKALLTKELEEFFVLLEQYNAKLKQHNDKINIAALAEPDVATKVVPKPEELTELYAQLQKKLKRIENLPSIKHLSVNLDDMINLYSSYEFNNPAIQHTATTGLIKEKELITQGYVPFVHGRRRSYDFLTQLYGLLMSVATEKTINPNFIPTHIKIPATNITEEKNKRKQLIAEGNPFPSRHDPEGVRRRQTLLFLNHFMFGNIQGWGSSSFLYMLSNDNAGNVAITTQDIFKMFGLESIYEKYATQLTELEKEYNDISRFGQILQVGIKPKKVQKAVYLTTSGGPKIKLSIFDKNWCEICTIPSDHINTIITYLNEDPQDQTEFALINTFDKYGGLNEHGMKISVLDPADYDPESYNKKIACNEKRDVLFAAIEADCMTTKDHNNTAGAVL